MRYAYEDANGESHFREIEVDRVEETPSGKNVITLAGGISITASGGETRHIGAGEIVIVEDTTGGGDITKSSGDKPATRSLDRAAGATALN